MGPDSGSFDHNRMHHVRHHHQAPPQGRSCTQTNLVSDGSVPAAHIADNLINPWGVSHAPAGPFWISDNGSGVTTFYDGAGNLIPVAGQDEQHGLFGSLTVMSDQTHAMPSPMMSMQS